MKCQYKFCRHETQEITDDDYIKDKNQYFHKDCHHEKQVILEIIDVFSKQINPNVVYSQLRQVIRRLVIEQEKCSADFLLFGINYYINHKIPLHYPQGLYYVLQNKDVANAWAKEEIKKEKQTFEVKENEEESFQYKSSDTQGFSSILID